MGFEETVNQVIEKIKPTEEDRLRLYSAYREIEAIISNYLSKKGLQAEVTLQGSVAKDTFLRGQSDIDVFIIFGPNASVKASDFENLIRDLQGVFRALGYHSLVEYAAHPYLVAYVRGVEVNIVPAFKYESQKQVLTAVDRSPLHTKFVVENTDEKLRDEIRFLKFFLRKWGLYGAEIAVQGFSGYLVELLVIAYRGLKELLRSVAEEWRPYRVCVDLKHYYGDLRSCLSAFEKAPLVVVDPVDPKRNVAAAVSLRSFSMFKLLSYLFCKCPSKAFFEDVPPECNVEELVEKLLLSGVCPLVVIIKSVSESPDITWGQIRRAIRIITNSLKDYGYNVVYYGANYNETEKLGYVYIEVEGCNQLMKPHRGPKAWVWPNAVKFLIKNADEVPGIWISDEGLLYAYRKQRRLEDVLSVVLSRIKSLNYLSVVDAIILDKRSANVPEARRGNICRFISRQKLSLLVKRLIDEGCQLF